MSEILDAIRNMPPAAADLVLLAAIVFGSGALGFALGIMWRFPEEEAVDQPTERRSERREYRDRRDQDA